MNKANRIFTVAALLFLFAAFTFHAPAVRAADYVFTPGELVLNPAEWECSLVNDTAWSIKTPLIIRRQNDYSSAVQFIKPITNYFEISFEMTLDSVPGHEGLTVRHSAGSHAAVLSHSEFRIEGFTGSSRKTFARCGDLKNRTRHAYHWSIRAGPESLTASVDGRTLTTHWEGGPPFRISFGGGSTGFRVKAIKITEIKK